MNQVEIITDKTVIGLKGRVNKFGKTHHIVQVNYTTYVRKDQIFFSCMVLYEM